MDRESKNLLMETYIKGFMLMGNHLDLESTTGRMAAISRVHLEMGSEMAKVCGKELLGIAISIKDNTIMTKSQDMVFLLGQQEIYIKETTKMILEMDMERCIGTMEAIIKENGKMVFKMGMDKSTSQAKDSKKEYFKIMFL